MEEKYTFPISCLHSLFSSSMQVYKLGGGSQIKFLLIYGLERSWYFFRCRMKITPLKIKWIINKIYVSFKYAPIARSCFWIKIYCIIKYVGIWMYGYLNIFYTCNHCSKTIQLSFVNVPNESFACIFWLASIYFKQQIDKISQQVQKQPAYFIY